MFFFCNQIWTFIFLNVRPCHLNYLKRILGTRLDKLWFLTYNKGSAGKNDGAGHLQVFSSKHKKDSEHFWGITGQIHINPALAEVQWFWETFRLSDELNPKVSIMYASLAISWEIEEWQTRCKLWIFLKCHDWLAWPQRQGFEMLKAKLKGKPEKKMYSIYYNVKTLHKKYYSIVI